MIPVFTTATVCDRAKTQTLEHGAVLLLWVVLVAAGAETIPEILIVLVVIVRGFVYHASFLTCLLIDAKSTGRIGRETRGAAVTDKVAFVKQLNQCVLAVAGDG